ncbi:MAG: hypothetical protein ACYDIA_06780 [Candidatus Humimicrobiaceae bacterium]
MSKAGIISPKKRVELALQRKFADKVPFTVYESLIPRSATERLLRNRGMCVVSFGNLAFSALNISGDYLGYKTYMPNVKTTLKYYKENGKILVRTDYRTPLGDLYMIHEPTQFNAWCHKRLFKSKEDYKALLFMIKDEQILPDYENVVKMEGLLGEDFILRGNIGYEPFQFLIGDWLYMNTEDFCYEWEDNRDEILKLYDALVENRRKRYEILADSPLTVINYGGNVTPEIIGLQRFEKYYIPNYEEAAETLHKKNKMIGVHFDANCRLLKDAIAKTSLDYIEAFTPFPDTDMDIKDARKAWPDKVLWINFPSSVHLQLQEKIEQVTYKIIDDAGTPEGLIIGITEDLPEDRWKENYVTIMNAIDKKFNIR